ncbi:MAG: 4-hydroxy-tetrahydrodipicolinate synthase [Bacteroidales bacterium]|nr:4-hydroxy-tetrahydrodipicolinate synthase [Bacteroidales bacterium]
MNELIFKGCGTALVTPFKEDGSIDYEAYAKSVARQVEAGIDFLVPLGTTAETPTLTAGEKAELLRLTRLNAPGVPLLAGVGTNSVPATIANMELLSEADGFLVVVPFYNKPTQEGQYQYFKAVAAATDKPIVLYNVPGRTGVNMEAATALRLAREIPNVVAIKEASGKISQISEILAGAPEGFSVLSGDDGLTYPILALGGAGVISVASNVVPGLMVEFISAALDGDAARALELHHKLSPLFKNLFCESSPIPAKAALSEMGLMGATLRLPLSSPSEKTVAIIKDTLKGLEL